VREDGSEALRDDPEPLLGIGDAIELCLRMLASPELLLLVAVVQAVVGQRVADVN
jgi:hypothetical protein